MLKLKPRPPRVSLTKFVQPVNSYNQAVRMANTCHNYGLRALIEGMPPFLGPGYFVWVWKKAPRRG